LARSESRPQDESDIRALLTAIDASERALAFEAARLIVSLGFARGKDLPSELTALLG
jgi:hypothetical protein